MQIELPNNNVVYGVILNIVRRSHDGLNVLTESPPLKPSAVPFSFRN
jgi:hypothetical protein